MTAAHTTRVLVIAGLDPCGGAGLTADARTIQACGAFPLTVPTCWTDQDRSGFRSAHPIADDALAAMLAAVERDGAIDAIKIGLFASPRTIELVARWLTGLSRTVPVVVDPVLSATAGGGPSAARTIARAIVERLAPIGPVLTPNRAELELLVAGRAEDLLARGARAVLVTGGDREGAEVVDELVQGEAGRVTRVELVHPRLAVGPVHGTGCALASALAVQLGRGVPIESACRVAIARVSAWIAATPSAPDGRPEPLRIGAEA